MMASTKDKARDRRLKDRRQAGQLLARALGAYAGRADAIVLALPRGGVPVGIAIAARLKLAFDILLVRKLGFPWQPELAMGAVASGGLRVLRQDLLDVFRVSAEVIEAATGRELQEIARREQCYRAGRPAPLLHGRSVILVDDGVATGSTMRAAVELVSQAGPARVIVAVPVCAYEARVELSALVDEFICLSSPEPFIAVGVWYRQFDQVGDAEVRRMLGDFWRPAAGPAGAAVE